MNSIASYPASRALPGLAQPGHGWWVSIGALFRRLRPTSLAVPKVRDPVREAAEVREMADAIRTTDPRFAADLYAAADRHERLYAGAAGVEQ